MFYLFVLISDMLAWNKFRIVYWLLPQILECSRFLLPQPDVRGEYMSTEKYIPLIRNPIGTACEYLGYVRLGLRGVAWGSIGHVIFFSRQQAANTLYTGYL